MPSRNTRRRNDEALRIGVAVDGSGGIGSLGVDLVTHDSLLSPFALRQGDRVRAYDGALTPAPGPKRIKVFTPAGQSRTFADVAKYATIPAAAQLRLPRGGFAIHFSITALRGAGNGYILHGQDGADATPPFEVYLGSDGVLKAYVNWDGGGQDFVLTSALTDGSVQHGWFIYDSVLGTLNLYLNGLVVGTPITGLASTKRPLQTAAMAWLVGATKTAAGVVSNPFMGKIDALQVVTLRGLQIATGSPSKLSTLLAHSMRQWPNPLEPGVVAQYDFDEASGTSMIDRSKDKNHGTYTGAPTVSAAVAFSHPCANYIGAFQGADGSVTNLVAAGGALFYETVKSGVT